jgi:hypothetical protein
MDARPQFSSVDFARALNRARHEAAAFSAAAETSVLAALQALLAKGCEREADELAKHFLNDCPPSRRMVRIRALLQLAATHGEAACH